MTKSESKQHEELLTQNVLWVGERLQLKCFAAVILVNLANLCSGQLLSNPCKGILQSWGMHGKFIPFIYNLKMFPT